MKDIDISECEVVVDESSDYTLKDWTVDFFINYVNENSEFKIERK